MPGTPNFDVITDWTYGGTSPTIRFFKAEESAGDDPDRKQVTVNFKRSRLICGGRGVFVDQLGEEKKGRDLEAFTGKKKIFAATSAATRPFICVADDAVPDHPHADLIRQIQVWQMVEESAEFEIPT